MAQKPSFGAGRGTGPSEGRYAGPRQWGSSHVIHCWCKSPWLTKMASLFPVYIPHSRTQECDYFCFFIWTSFYFWDWTWICCRKTKLLELGKGETYHLVLAFSPCFLKERVFTAWAILCIASTRFQVKCKYGFIWNLPSRIMVVCEWLSSM